MTRKRRRFTAEFKAQVVLAVLTGEQTPAEVCRAYGLSPALLSLWKATFLQRAHAAFQADDRRGDEHARIAELERMVGRLTMEREILKKASTLLPGLSPANGRRP
jgi:transposase-like protein